MKRSFFREQKILKDAPQFIIEKIQILFNMQILIWITCVHVYHPRCIFITLRCFINKCGDYFHTQLTHATSYSSSVPLSSRKEKKKNRLPIERKVNFFTDALIMLHFFNPLHSLCDFSFLLRYNGLEVHFRNFFVKFQDYPIRGE